MAAGKLTVKKVPQGVDTNHEFTFHLVATSGNQITKDETFKLKHNQEITFTIPANSTYTVEELESYGFKLLSFTNNQGTIESGDEITAIATNIQLGYATMEKKLTM